MQPGECHRGKSAIRVFTHDRLEFVPAVLTSQDNLEPDACNSFLEPAEVRASRQEPDPMPTRQEPLHNG